MYATYIGHASQSRCSLWPAEQLSGIPERSRLLREALQALVARESARRLARLGGSELQLEVPPRCYRESTWTVAP
ncbi:hypothetical protein KBY90_00470 [Cyanobium sp. CH-040]|nr:hypothetical protein [Cyanobium sp. CH-040]